MNDDTQSLGERKNTLLARVRTYALYIDPLLGRAAALRGKIKMEAREIRVPSFFTGPPRARATSRRRTPLTRSVLYLVDIALNITAAGALLHQS